MLASVFGLLVLTAVGANAHEGNAQFDDFIEKYNRSYDDAEYDQRLAVFTANLKQITALKAAGDATVGINEFADMTVDEFKQLLIPSDFATQHPPRTSQPGDSPFRRKRATTIPTSFDYRTKGWVTPVKNQGQCGACWAFAAIAGMETVFLRSNKPAMDLSEQVLLDCDSPPNYKCTGGWTDVALDYIIANGTTTEAAYPYRDYINGPCRNSIARPWKGVFYVYLTAEAQIPSFVYGTGPVAFYFRVPGSFMLYTGGVFNPADCIKNIVGLHEMVIVGYTPTYWIVKNSWGTGFGAAGYVYFARGKNLCGMATQLIAMY